MISGFVEIQRQSFSLLQLFPEVFYEFGPRSVYVVARLQFFL